MWAFHRVHHIAKILTKTILAMLDRCESRFPEKCTCLKMYICPPVRKNIATGWTSVFFKIFNLSVFMVDCIACYVRGHRSVSFVSPWKLRSRLFVWLKRHIAIPRHICEQRCLKMAGFWCIKLLMMRSGRGTPVSQCELQVARSSYCNRMQLSKLLLYKEPLHDTEQPEDHEAGQLKIRTCQFEISKKKVVQWAKSM